MIHNIVFDMESLAEMRYNFQRMHCHPTVAGLSEIFSNGNGLLSFRLHYMVIIEIYRRTK